MIFHLRSLSIRHRLSSILFFLCLLLLPACNGIPVAPTPTTTVTPAMEIDAAVQSAVLRQRLGTDLSSNRYAQVIVVRRFPAETAETLGYNGKNLQFVSDPNQLSESVGNRSYLLVQIPKYQGPNDATVEVVDYVAPGRATGSLLTLHRSGNTWSITNEKVVWVT